MKTHNLRDKVVYPNSHKVLFDKGVPTINVQSNVPINEGEILRYEGLNGVVKDYEIVTIIKQEVTPKPVFTETIYKKDGTTRDIVLNGAFIGGITTFYVTEVKEV